MKKIYPSFVFLFLLTIRFSSSLFGQDRVPFHVEKDLLLVHYDCKTDVDDLHSVAAFATLLANSEFTGIKYHAVAGTYGIQSGLYVPANELFELAFKNHWSDAHTDFEKALKKVYSIAKKTLKKGGNVWISEAGQSDFTAALIQEFKTSNPEIDTKNRIFVVQHSSWNEKSTDPDKLKYVKELSTYYKIEDGNAVGNGTPGYRTEEIIHWKSYIKNPHLTEVWNLAIALGNQYNGKENRYNNEAIFKGGLDFSDTAEICWILGIEHENVNDFLFILGMNDSENNCIN